MGAAPANKHLKYAYKKRKLPFKPVTYQGMAKAASQIPSSEFSEINKSLFNRYLKKTSKHKPYYDKSRPFRRILAIDGTYTSCSKELAITNPEQFNLTSTGRYAKSLTTFIYDVENRVPIAYDSLTYAGERDSFKRLKHHLLPGDLLIFDSGYFGATFINTLIKEGYHIVLRIPESWKTVYNGTNLPAGTRYVSYTVPKPPFQKSLNKGIKKSKKSKTVEKFQTFKILTTLPAAQYSTQQISNLYHQRWQIEELYKVYKTDLDGSFYSCRNLESFKSKQEIQFFIMIIVGIIHQIKNKGSTKRLSYHYTLEYIEDWMFLTVELSKGALKHLTILTLHIQECCFIKTGKFRHNLRVAIIDRGHWYHYGEKPLNG